MSEISAATVCRLRYAPEGAAAVRAYNYNGVEGLTLAQLMMACSFRRAAQTEQACVNAMNQLSLSSDRLADISHAAQFVLQFVQSGAPKSFGRWSKWSDVRAFLVNIGLQDDKTALPEKLEPGTSYSTVMGIYEQIRPKLTECNSTNETQVVELQTAVNRRDVVYNTVSSTITGLGKSALACAMRLK